MNSGDGMHHAASASSPWIVAMLIASICLGLAGAVSMFLGVRMMARDVKAQKLRRRAWRLTVASLNRAGLNQKVVIDNDRRGDWRCTVNRRHDATECNGYHLSHDDI
jgi:hypothetical protein